MEAGDAHCARLMRATVFAALSLLCSVCATFGAGRGSFLTLTEENDDFALNGDRHYTQGARIAYTLCEDRTPDWTYSLMHRLPGWGLDIQTVRLGFTLGQNIYTPAKLWTSAWMSDDRPYAGYIYFGTYAQRTGTMLGIPVLDTAELDVGLIGPYSLGEQAQRWWHGIGDWIQPQGWNNQLKTEPGLTLKLNRQWKFSPTKPENGWGIEMLPQAGVSLGNVMTFGQLGAMLRAGYNIPEDFGVQNIDSLAAQYGGRGPNTPIFGAYVFAAADGKAVAHNAFLDGNLWQRSHSISKNPFVAEFKAGGVLTTRYFEIAMTFMMRTCEFKTQQRCDRFGSLTLTAKF
jgi:hypothetical protein